MKNAEPIQGEGIRKGENLPPFISGSKGFFPTRSLSRLGFRLGSVCLFSEPLAIARLAMEERVLVKCRGERELRGYLHVGFKRNKP